MSESASGFSSDQGNSTGDRVDGLDPPPLHVGEVSEQSARRVPEGTGVARKPVASTPETFSDHDLAVVVEEGGERLQLADVVGGAGGIRQLCRPQPWSAVGFVPAGVVGMVGTLGITGNAEADRLLDQNARTRNAAIRSRVPLGVELGGAEWHSRP